MEGELYDSDYCSDLCSQLENDVNGITTSTLTINTRNMPPVTIVIHLNIVCVVNQTLVGPPTRSQTNKVKPVSRLERSKTAQLTISPAPAILPPVPSMTTTFEISTTQGDEVASYII